MRASNVVMALGGILVLGAVGAQAQTRIHMRADVPFEFTAGRTTFPAGQYDVTFDEASPPGVLLVRSHDGRGSAFVLTDATIAKEAPRDTKLVFERRGEGYVLHEVFAAGDRDGREVTGTESSHSHAE